MKDTHNLSLPLIHKPKPKEESDPISQELPLGNFRPKRGIELPSTLKAVKSVLKLHR
jgi:hypothetical protein